MTGGLSLYAAAVVNQVTRMNGLKPRINRENKTVAAMIKLYCGKHHNHGGLCRDCSDLAEYARQRLEKCPFQEGKTTCVKCSVHCYSSVMRERVRVVMRYAGPRMPYRHPLLAMWHILDGQRKEPVRLNQKPG